MTEKTDNPSARLRIHEILEIAKPGDFGSRVADITLVVLVASNVLAVILESVASLASVYGTFFNWFESFSVAIFTIEYGLRLWTCIEDHRLPDCPPLISRLRYMISPLALLDLAAFLPYYLSMFFGIDLRFLRALRLLRLFKLARYSPALSLVGAVFAAEARAFGIALSLLIVVIIFASSGIYLAEQAAQPEAFSSIPAAMWWSIATLTTVGYGDITPITTIGKIFGACVMIAGIGMVALPAGLLASGFSEQIQRRREHFSRQVTHALKDGVIDADERHLLNRLSKELGFSEQEALHLLDSVARNDGRRQTRCPHCGEDLRAGPGHSTT